MFKKTLLALALTGAAVSANAASVINTSTGSVLNISEQGLPATKATTLATVADAATLQGFDGTTSGQEYIKVSLKAADNGVIVAGSRLVVNITGAFFSDPSKIIVTAAAADFASADNDEGFTVSTAESTSSKLVITLAGTLTVADNDFIRIGNLGLITKDSSISVSSVFETASKVQVASTAAPAKAVAAVTDQWKAGIVTDVTATTPTSGVLSAEIDVANGRKTFDTTGSATSATTDTLTFDVETQGSGATPVSAVSTISGDFTGVASVVATNNGTATYTINDDKTKATYTYNTTTDTTVAELVANASSVLFTLETAATKVTALSVRDFDLKLDLNYTDAESNAGKFSLINGAAGSWKLNGVSKTIDYMPMGPNTAPIIQATSTFTEDASVSVSYLNETTGKMVTLTDIATVKANQVTKLGSAIAAAVLADAAVDSMLTKLIVTINAPSTKVSLFTGFKDTSDKDRLGVPNT